MEFLLENRNKLSWLAGDWLQQEKDSMKVYSGGLSCNLPTASVRAAFPVVEDILSSQPAKQFSLLLPPELFFGYKELGSLEAFLMSGKMPPRPLEQMKKMKSFLEEACGSQIHLAVSKFKIYNNNVGQFWNLRTSPRKKMISPTSKQSRETQLMKFLQFKWTQPVRRRGHLFQLVTGLPPPASSWLRSHT